MDHWTYVIGRTTDSPRISQHPLANDY